MQTILIYFSLLYLFIYFMSSFFDNILKYLKWHRIVSFMLLILSLAIIAITWEPKTNDLTRQFVYMNNIRNYKGSLFDFLLDSTVGGSQYKNLYVFNIIRFVIAKTFKNNMMLPFIITIIDYSIIIYILMDFNKEKISKGILSPVFLSLCFGCMPLLFVISGIRNALAACIMALAVYLFLYKNVKVYYFLFISIIAALIHPVALMAAFLALIAKLNLGLRGVIIIFAVIFSLNNLANILSNSSYSYLRQYSKYYLSYTSDSQYRSANYYLYFDIVILLIMVISYCVCKKDLLSKEEKKLYYFLTIYSVSTLAFIGNYDMILRPCYFIGAFSPIAYNLVETKHLWPKKNRWLRIFIKILIILMFILMFYKYMSFFYSWSYNIL